MWAEETEQECGLGVVVVVPGVDADAQRVDVAEAVGAEWVFIGDVLKCCDRLFGSSVVTIW